MPDETTVCKFRRRLEAHGLGEPLFAAVRQYLHKHGLRVSTGSPDRRHPARVSREFECRAVLGLR